MFDRLREGKSFVSWYESKAFTEREGGGFWAHVIFAAVYRVNFDSIDRTYELPSPRDVMDKSLSAT